MLRLESMVTKKLNYNFKSLLYERKGDTQYIPKCSDLGKLREYKSYIFLLKMRINTWSLETTPILMFFLYGAKEYWEITENN